MSSDWRVGVDIGGTFTDLVVVGPDGQATMWKESTTPERPEEAIERGLRSLGGAVGEDLDAFLGRVDVFVHGSTIAINAVLQRRGALVGLVTTEGFRDVLHFRDGFKWNRYDARLPRPEDFVARHLRLGVRERIDRDGAVVTELDEDDVRRAAAQFRASGVEAVAVALLWSQVNPVHERRIGELLAEELPGIPVMLSSDVLPELGEWVRTSATVLSAYIVDGVRGYMKRLAEWLASSGLRRQLLIMQLNGGCATVEQTLRVPVNSIGSGPAGGPAGALQVGGRLGAGNLIVTDMGGTSFDVSLVRHGELGRSRTLEVDHQPLGVPGVEVHSIGAGGGSIAWIDSGGALRVGPQSAGASPGPVAYGDGGTEPTVTDANIVLGYLSPTAFLGGRRRLQDELAAEAIRTRIAEPLGIGVAEAALGIVRLVNHTMVDAIGVISIERGIDPRDFVLVAGGGAGPLHAGRLAEELGIDQVLVPAEASVLSAFGMAMTDVRQDYVGTLHTDSRAPDVAAVAELVAGLESTGREDLLANGFADEHVVLERYVDARYRGQVHELITPVPDGELTEELVAAITAEFHRLHEERYGWAADEYAVEFLHWRVTAVGLTDRPQEPRFPEARTGVPVAQSGTREAYFEELGGFVETPVYVSADVPAGGRIEGPALVEADITTIVVWPGQAILGDGRGSFLLRSPERAAAPLTGSAAALEA